VNQIKKILIVDTKAGNLFSIKSAVERLGFTVEVLAEPSKSQFDGIVIPGQGRFGAVMNNLRKSNWQEYFEKQLELQTPILGICVGMQIFFEQSDEDLGVDGFGWFAGKAESLNFPKTPMVGWAKLSSSITTWNDNIVYFVNSFAVRKSDCCIAETSYGETFCAAVKKGSFVGVQFHPEKSGKVGSQLISQVLCSVVGDFEHG
jgi:imidazole glycerol-phosphate synthase subunit HisH